VSGKEMGLEKMLEKEVKAEKKEIPVA